MSLKLRARKIPLNRGGYDRDGRYYGVGDPIYEVYNPKGSLQLGGESGEGFHDTESYTLRAPSKEAAIRKVKIEVLRSVANQRRRASFRRHSISIHRGSFQNADFNDAYNEAREAFDKGGWRGQTATMRRHAIQKRRKRMSTRHSR